MVAGKLRFLMAALGALILGGVAFTQVLEAASPSGLPSGFVGWWRGDGSADDASGNGHNGAWAGTPAYANGVSGQAFSFDGASFIAVPDAPDLNFGPGASMTAALWVYRTGTAPIQHLLGKRGGCSPAIDYQIALDVTTGEGLSFSAGFGTGAASGQDLPLNRWTHLAGTYDGTTYRLYINGALAASRPGQLGPVNNAPLEIGKSGSCTPFTGLIDEVSLYNRALTDAEIAASYGTPTAVTLASFGASPDAGAWPLAAAAGGLVALGGVTLWTRRRRTKGPLGSGRR